MRSFIPRNNELQKKRWTLKHFNVRVLSSGTQSILLLNVKVPPYVQEGTKAKIICMYEIELDGLYR